MTTAQKVVNYLKSCKGMLEASPVVVEITGVEYPGAKYKQRFPDGHVVEAIYLVGALPNHHGKSPKTAYRVPDDQRDWYVACYFPEVKKGKQAAVVNEYHPFGCNFLLTPWDIAGKPENKIDSYEKPYRRIPISVRPASSQ